MRTRLKKHWLIPACFLILLGSTLFRGLAPEISAARPDIPSPSGGLYSIQPVKDCAALATATFSAAAPQVISLRTQQQFQQQPQGRHQLLHGLRPKPAVRPRQADKITTTFCRRNIYPVDFFIYFLQEIII